ncbi:methionine--tRNA ligase [Eubacterium multiforme]|uniref:methionine--tRNA ligase n=1 Tax=Eubacterium multiforme TaxID=83339 RepID=A0ABT9UVA0_9FIRM|nr:class I tRNA ligase family protein [Eubacterium multiforme]MDQ0150204.1 methionyl-tRNA synthetase [Eubacterium multiforme]
MKVIIGNAWPYANGKLHLGRIAVFLPGDILARYHRMMGDDVIFISGSDAHGHLVKRKAKELKITPKETLDKYHREFLNCFKNLNFSFDLFTHTDTEYHQNMVKDFILELYKNGYIYEETSLENNKESKHLFFALSKVEKDVKKMFIKQEFWRKNSQDITKRYIDEGLRDRTVTKEIDWGVNVPLDGYSDKKIFVWIEALMGYITATSKYLEGKEDKLSDYWDGDDSKVYLVHGKDNIPFHTIVFPGLLAALGFKNTKLNIISSEHLKLEGKDFSTNKNWAIWVDEILKKYDVDTLRYYLILNGPEFKDTDFKWKNFINSHNYDLALELNELYKKAVLNGNIKECTLEEKNRMLNLYFSVGEKIEYGEFKSALKEIFSYIKEENKKIKPSINIVINLANILEPFLPKTSRNIKEKFCINECIWNFISIKKIPENLVYNPIFESIDKKNIIEEIKELKENKFCKNFHKK